MQRNDAARTAVLPRNAKWGAFPTARSNEDLCRAAGLTNAQIQSLNERARTAGMDALVLLCQDRGVPNMDSLLN